MDQVLQHWQTKLKAITPEPKEKIAFNKWHEILWAKVWWKWNPAQLIYIHVGIDLKGVFSRNANMELFLSMEIVALHGGNLEKYFIEFKTKIFTDTFLLCAEYAYSLLNKTYQTKTIGQSSQRMGP